MENKKMVPCKHCGQEIAAAARVCPHCGAKNRKPVFKKWWFWVIVVVIICAAASGGGTGTTKTKTEADESQKKEVSSVEAVSDDTSHTDEAEVSSESIVEDVLPEQAEQAENVPEEEEIPTEYKSAVKKAESYAQIMHMSKQGIYDQLTSEYGEQFTKEAADYAMEHVDIDWNANALKKAEDYSSTMHMSKSGIYDQLISEHGEQFTKEEAQYAVDHLEADYKANALAKAKSYQDMDMSPSAIYDQLISEYGEKFTKEEAQYAVDHLE